MKRILFLKFGALGDILMATPLVRQTRRAFPKSQIDFQTAKPFGIALQGNRHLDAIHTFAPEIFTNRQLGKTLRLCREIRRRHYDAVFVLDKHPVFALIARLAGIPIRVGFARDLACQMFLTHSTPFGELRHDLISNLDLLSAVGIGADYTDYRMEFRRDGVTVAKPVGSYFACTNSGGDNAREATGIRRLPRESFLDLLADLSLRKTVVLLGGKSDYQYYSALELPSNVLNLAGTTSLPQCAELIAGADEFFTTDCGLMHLAATTDTPICAFFGPTHPGRKAPLRENVRTHWADAAIYDPEYDRRGRLRSGERYFQTLAVAGCAG